MFGNEGNWKDLERDNLGCEFDLYNDFVVKLLERLFIWIFFKLFLSWGRECCWLIICLCILFGFNIDIDYMEIVCLIERVKVYFGIWIFLLLFFLL